LLASSLPAYIIEGLEVTATDPETSNITISAGSGSKGGTVFTLEEDTTIDVPLSTEGGVVVVSLYKNRVMLDKDIKDNALELAKIIIPSTTLSRKIYNKKNQREDELQAYIITFREVKLYSDVFGNLEEDSVEFLRNNIGEILADNLIGNIRLSEDLKITNTQGTLSIDSNSVKIFDTNNKLSSKFDGKGVFFYNATGKEFAKFTTTEAKLGNIKILPNSIQSTNFVQGSTGFQLLDTGDVEFNNLTVRGTIYALAGEIGGFTIASNKLYGGTLQTSATVGSGSNGVIIDSDGIRVYDDILGNVINLPSDGSAPFFSSGTITEVNFEIQTNTVIRTSETAGDGTALSEGILINSTGLYGFGANQIPSNANLRVLSNGNIYLQGEIVATSGTIGSVTITPTKLTGGIIEGATLIGTTISTSDTIPRINIDADGIYYQVSTAIGKYGQFKYGDGTLYGAGVSASLFSQNFPTFAVLQENELADIRLYNRTLDPSSGSHSLGDIICVDSVMKICKSAGSPGTFHPVLTANGNTGFDSTYGDYVEVEIDGTVRKLIYMP
jgi:hypothetical protein